ncbi:MAG: VIT domain-containing protein [Myxococcales bacterium]|nr:VIT domain-containing protein [Myxococcales bacterium]
MTRTASKPLFLLLLSLLALACKDAESKPAASASGGGGVIAEVVKIVGAGGVQAARLEPGTFLGVGGQLQAGDRIQVPAGTLARIALSNRIQLDLNEDSEITLSQDPNAIALERGEVVVDLKGADQPLRVRAGKDSLQLSSGLSRLQRYDDEGSYSIVEGRGQLDRGGRRVELLAGMWVHTPLSDAHRPRTSAAVAQEIDWALAFDNLRQAQLEVPRGVGSLKARAAGSSYEFQPLRLTDQEVQVSVAGRIAHTRVEQSFYNSASQVLEGIYRFPLPADASISNLELLVGDTWMRAEMLEKKRAQHIFQQIVDATVPRDPALLEWEQGSIFKMRIFPIPAKGARKIRLSYTQVLKGDSQVLRYRYPMGGSASGASGTSIDNFRFEARIDRRGLGTEELEGVRSVMLETRHRMDEGALLLQADAREFTPASDLGFDIPRASSGASHVHQETFLGKDGKAYFLLALRPELSQAREPGRAVDYAFVFDRSHSTAPELWAMAATTVQTLVERMEESDRFTLLACDTACDELGGGMRPGGTQGALEVKRFTEGQDLMGASDVANAVSMAAARLRDKARADAEPVVVYLGDGIASAGPLDPNEVAQALKPALQGVRVEALALGARSDLNALRALAEVGQGDVMRLDPTDHSAQIARQLSLRARLPAVTGLALELPEGLYDVHPRELGSLRSGDELLLVGKLRHPVDGEVRIHGDGVDARFAVALAAERGDDPSPHAHLPRTWAREEIDRLERTRGDGARAEIVELSKRYTVISRHTALLALENDAMYREFGVAREAATSEGWDGETRAQSAADTRALDDAVLELATKGSSFAGRKDLGDEDDSIGEVRDIAEETTLSPHKTAAPKMKKSAARPAHRTPSGGGLRSRSIDAQLGNPYGGASRAQGAPSRRASAKPRPPAAPRPTAAAPASERSPTPAEAADEAAAEAEPADVPSLQLEAKAERRGRVLEMPFEDSPRPLQRRPRPRPRHMARIARSARPPSDKDLARVAELVAARDRDPGQRAAHAELVRTGLRLGHPEARSLAAAWVEADPDHPEALRAFADALYREGDSRAMRAYASAVEVRPFSARYQKLAADGHARLGDHARACAHRRALVSIDGRQERHHLELAHCLLTADRSAAAKSALEQGLASARDKGPLRKLLADIASNHLPKQAPTYLHPSANVEISLSWEDPSQELDIVLVDRRGRRLSALWSGVAAVREAPGEEKLTVNDLSGTLHVEVTHRDVSGSMQTADGDAYSPTAATRPAGAAAKPVRAKLTVRAGNTKSFPVALSGGSVRVATITSEWR